MNKRYFDRLCSECEKPTTPSAIIGIGRNCLIKNYKEFGCPNHGEGELVIKKTWIGVRNCTSCLREVNQYTGGRYGV